MLVLISALLLSTQSFACAQSAYDAASYEENGAVGKDLHLPIYHWWQPGTAIRGYVVAVHGLVMHGRSYDALGRTLAARGFDVYALDLRGYGRCLTEGHQYCNGESDCKHRIDYEKSYDDLTRLARCLRDKNPSVPLFAVGESLGGTFAIKLAARNPELVDGLILSAPAVKRHSFIDPYMIANAGLMMANPRAQLDLMPFVRKFSSDDPRVIAEKESDPLLRRSLSAYEILQSGLEVHRTASYVPEVPQNIPVLVIQGSADRCIKAKSVMYLLSKLHSSDQTVKWFRERGHILLETSFVKPDTMDAVVSWLGSHVDNPAMQAKYNRTPDIIANGVVVAPPQGVLNASISSPRLLVP
jgi:alpha-beta hydrolase superfamily lysophospholipase